jgi:hypothetical protein
VRRENGRLIAEADGEGSWSLLLRGETRQMAVEGGTAQPEPLGLRVTPAPGRRSVRV